MAASNSRNFGWYISPLVLRDSFSSKTVLWASRLFPGDPCSSVRRSEINSRSPLMGWCRRRGRSSLPTWTLQPPTTIVDATTIAAATNLLRCSRCTRTRGQYNAAAPHRRLRAISATFFHNWLCLFFYCSFKNLLSEPVCGS